MDCFAVPSSSLIQVGGAVDGRGTQAARLYDTSRRIYQKESQVTVPGGCASQGSGTFDGLFDKIFGANETRRVRTRGGFITLTCIPSNTCTSPVRTFPLSMIGHSPLSPHEPTRLSQRRFVNDVA